MGTPIMLANDNLISKTKVILPKRRLDLFSRQRLLKILYERIDRKLIIVSAAAGYGKTSLLIDLAYHAELPFCWLSLDSLDRDPQRFAAGVIAAIAERFKDFGKRSETVVSGMTNLDDGMERLLVTLVNEIYDEIHEHFIIVLDDFHVVDEAKPILYFVNRFVQLVGENCHVVLASRTLPELQDIPLLVAREEVGGLDYSDLAFRPDEIQALLARNRQIYLSDVQARQLVEATEGWITGLQFAEPDSFASSPGSVVPAAPHKVRVTVFDYLGQQVLEQQPADIRTFLLRTSLFDEFDSDVCQAVLGPIYGRNADLARMLDTITQKNLFTQAVGPNGQWIRYHHLFRDYLQGKLRKECPDEIDPILRGLAGYYETAGQWEKAYQVRTQLGDMEALASMIERAGIPMYQHAMLTLESWLKVLPPSVTSSRPGLLSLRGNIELIKGNTEDSLMLFDRAVAIYTERGPQEALALAMVRRANAYRLVGRFTEAMQDADRVLTSSEINDAMEWVHGDALRIHGLCLYRLGRTPEAIRYLQQALDVYTRVHDTASIPLLLMEIGLAHMALGTYAESKSHYEKALHIWRQEGNLSLQATLLNNYGVLHQQMGEYEEAAQCLEEGLLCARRSGYKRMEALISLGLGDLYAELEDFDIAAQNYRQASELIEQLNEPFLNNYLGLMMANLALLRGDGRQARQLIGQAAISIQGSPSNLENGLLQLLTGRLELLEHHLPSALPALQEAKRLFGLAGREMELAWATVWLSAAEYKAGSLEQARSHIKEVIPDTKRVDHAAIISARQAMGWLGALRKDPEIRSLVRGLFDKADRMDAKLPAARRQLRRLAHTIEIPTPGLIIHAFGTGQVWLHGRAVTARDWQTQSVRELFFYFLYSSKPLTREQIGAHLWPDTEDPARFKMRFKNEIYRLRRAVGQDTILFDGDTYRFNASADHEYDIEAFEAYLRKARSATAHSDQIGFYERAINLVQGKYLEDISASWVIAEQERLHQAFLEAVLALAELYQKEGQYPKAIDICQRAVARDKTAEPVYQALMKIFGHLGDRASVAHVYNSCVKNMRESLQVEPSDETTKLYQSLTD